MGLAPSDGKTPKQRYVQRWGALKSERSSWDTHWKDIAEHIRPRSSRFLSGERNKGDKQNSKINNGVATYSARVLESGMMSGITSPARKWFRLTTPDPSLAEMGAVKQWLSVVEDLILEHIAKSNIYLALQEVYGQIGAYGVAALLLEEDPNDVLRAYVFPIGSYCLATSGKQRVDTLYRQFSMTVGQLVDDFGLEKCSARVQELYAQRQLDTWIEVVLVIEPNASQEPGRGDYRGKAWKSCWFELSTTGAEDDKLLRESGFEEFPVLAPRWAVNGEDVYGSSPGMDALADVRELQLLEKRKTQAFEKLVNPPMTGGSGVGKRRISLLPGDVTVNDAPNEAQRFRPAMEIAPTALGEFREAIREKAELIRTAFHADLWLMMSQGANTEMTAREVAERHEEKMLQLGPVMERLQKELLAPLNDRVFAILLRRGLIPPAPEELQGVEAKVEYLSIMAQAQKLVGSSAVERLVTMAVNLSAAVPSILDKVDFDQLIDEMANMLGVPPSLVRTDEAVAALRAGRAKAEAQQQQLAAAGAMAKGAKELSQADTEGKNGLTDLLGALGGVAGVAPPGLQ